MGSEKSIKFFSLLVIFTLLEVIVKSQTSKNENSGEFMHQDVYASQMMLDNLVISTSDNNQDSAATNLVFKPNILDFLQRSIGDPHNQVVILFNKHKNRSVYLGSISGSTPDFYSSYFKDKVIPPEGNTTFNVVFLPRQLGATHGSLLIHTSFGQLKYQVKGEGVECPYRLRPLVGLKAPLNSTLTPEILLYNPHDTTLQIVEVYSSGGNFQLELPSGAQEGPQALWEIPPHSTKPIIRVRFTGKSAGNHTAYVRIKISGGHEDPTLVDKMLVVPIEIEILKDTGIYSKMPFLDFGIVGSHDNITKLNLNLLNSGDKLINIKSWGIEGDMDAILCIQVNIQRFTRNDNIADRLFIEIDWSKITVDKKYMNGNIYINTAIENETDRHPEESNVNTYRIPFAGQILKGSIEYNENTLKFLTSNDKINIKSSRNLIIRNKFNVPLSITNITVPDNCSENFLIDGFQPNIIQPNNEGTLLQIARAVTTNLNKTISTYIKLVTNITEYELPIMSYSGTLKRIVPLDANQNLNQNFNIDIDEKELNFGILPISTIGESLIAFVNKNPISIPITHWKATILSGSTEAATIAVILRGCGPMNLDFLVFCHTVKPGEWIVYQITVQSSAIDTFNGRFTIKTDYEEIITPIKFTTAMGRLDLIKELLHFDNCFPGKLCSLNLTAHSTFLTTMQVEGVSEDTYGITYEYSEDDEYPEIFPNVITNIGRLFFDPKTICKTDCYSSFDLLSKPFGVKWMATLDNYEQYNKLDNEKLMQQLKLFNETKKLLKSITFRLTTNEIKRLDFNATVDFVWPKLLTENIHFPTIQIEQETVKLITINNPSDQLLFVHLVLHDINLHGTNVVETIPSEVLSKCTNCSLSPDNVFSFFLFDDDDIYVNYVKPKSILKIAIKFTSKVPGVYSTIFYMRNNLTLIDAVWIQAKSVVPQFKFGNRKPGSSTPLLFEITDKHLKMCSKFEAVVDDYNAIRTKRTFTARNYGEVPIIISGIRIEDSLCEGFGFKILDCSPFELQPNASKKIEIAFMPDFTLARVTRTLYIDSNVNFPVNFTLLGTVPAHGLEACSLSLKRPTFETLLRISLFGILTIALFGALLTAFLDANKVFRDHFQSLSRDKGPVQPPLDLRQIGLPNPLTPDEADKPNNTNLNNSNGLKSNPNQNSNSKKKPGKNNGKMFNSPTNTSGISPNTSTFNRSWSDFTSKLTRNKPETSTNSTPKQSSEMKNTSQRNRRSITPPKEEPSSIKEKNKIVIEEDSSSTTTESSVNSDTSSTSSTHSSFASNLVNKPNLNKSVTSDNSSESNSINMNTTNKVNVKKTKSLPVNYESTETTTATIKDNGCTISSKSKSQNEKVKTVVVKQPIAPPTNVCTYLPIVPNQNGLTPSEPNIKNEAPAQPKKFSKTPGRERKSSNQNKKSTNNKPIYKGTNIQFTSPISKANNTHVAQPMSIWGENRARFSDVVAQSPFEKAKMLSAFEIKMNVDRTNLTQETLKNSISSKDESYVENDVKDSSCSPVDLGPIGGTKKSPSSTPNCWEPFGNFLQRPIPVSSSNILNSDSYFSATFPEYNHTNDQFQQQSQQNIQNSMDLPTNQTSPIQTSANVNANNVLNSRLLDNYATWDTNAYILSMLQQERDLQQINDWDNGLWTPMGYPQQQIQPPQSLNLNPPNNDDAWLLDRPSNIPLRAPPGLTLLRDRSNAVNGATQQQQPENSQLDSLPPYDPFSSLSSIWAPENNDAWTNTNKQQ